MRLSRTPLLLAVLAVLTIPSAAFAQAQSVCDGAQMVPMPDGSTACTHGNDTPPPFPFATKARDLSTASLADDGTVACTGDGTSGERVQFLYVVGEDKADDSAAVIPKIRAAAAAIDDMVRRSAQEYDTGFRLRWVHDENCRLDVQTVVVPAESDDAFTPMVHQLAALGYDQPGRHYVTWVDARDYCGLASFYPDDSPEVTNHNNGAFPLYARIDRGCFENDSFAPNVTLHEITHMLGAVQASAPHATVAGHCTDEYDVMCYDDDGDGPVTTDVVCEERGRDVLWDCGGDDYFNPSSQPGSYLSSHWNIARSSFLEQTAGPAVSPVPESPTTPTTTRSQFVDVDPSHPFLVDIGWLAESGITRGCNPPDNTRFCPDDSVTRGQMAAFLNRALTDPLPLGAPFADTAGTVFDDDVRRLAGAGITHGCSPDHFCPDQRVSRGQMAAFLVRAFHLPEGGNDFFTDDDGSVFEGDIDRLAAAGITTGCSENSFCPDDPITRGQLAAFLRRALT